jgi:hypothetical protein
MSSAALPSFGISKKQLIEALDAVMPQVGAKQPDAPAIKSDIGATLSVVPDWVLATAEWGNEYDRLKVKHSQWWNYVPGFKKQPSDDATRVLAAINVMRDIAKRRHTEAKALDAQWQFLETSLKKNEAIYVD